MGVWALGSNVVSSAASRCWHLPPWVSEPAVLHWPLSRVSLPGGRDAFQSAATEHLTLKVSSDL